MIPPLGAVALLALFVYLTGAAVARALGPADLFFRVSLGVAATSIAGLVLTHLGMFSPIGLVAVLAVVAAVSVAIGWARGSPATSAGLDVAPTSRTVACAAGLVAFISAWPPYETVVAAQDSTMYVNAAIHLARTGSLAVPETVTPLLEPADARALFASVAYDGSGPYIRLPGGLLMASLSAREAVPAFFPLVSVWAASLAAIAGPEGAPAVAPVFAAFGVWAVVLLAGETLGLAAAAATALLLLANFAVWWFARFPVSEMLALGPLWSGLVLVARATRDDTPAPARRAAAMGAGTMLGLAAVARPELFAFLLAAGALWWAWTSPRLQLGSFLAPLLLLAILAVVMLAATPSHHRAYLVNDAMWLQLRMLPQLTAATSRSGLAIEAAVLAALLVGAGLLGRRFGVGFFGGALRALTIIAVVAAVLAYVRLGGTVRPARHLAWIAAYCSWPLLGLAAAGGFAIWRRGGAAIRLALLLVAVVAIAFICNPRVGAFQPWAIRRFVPVVLPGLILAAAGAIAVIGATPRPALRLAALAVALGTAVLELRPMIAVRQQAYFAGNFAATRALAAEVPAGAIVAMDSSFADLQLGVPLWLMHEREVVMLSGGTRRWREVMARLASRDRPLVWIANRYAEPPLAPGLRFGPSHRDLDLVVPLPEGPTNVPPARTVTRVVPLRLYGVTADGGDRAAAGEAGRAAGGGASCATGAAPSY